jgi:hypothetical protein
MPIPRPDHILRRSCHAASPVVVIAVAAAIAGCGSSSDETETGEPPASTSTAPASQAPIGVRAKSCKDPSTVTGEIRVTGLPCAAGRLIAEAWSRTKACAAPAGASRTSCRLGGLTCLGAVTGRGIAVTCAEPGRSLSFVGKRG